MHGSTSGGPTDDADDEEEDNNEVEDNDKDNSNDKGISALGLETWVFARISDHTISYLKVLDKFLKVSDKFLKVSKKFPISF